MKRKDTFTIGVIVRKPQSPTWSLGILNIVWTTILSDWSGFLNVILMIGAVACVIFDIKLAGVVLFSLCLAICLYRLIANKDRKKIGIRIFNVVITIILLLLQIF
jgi:hypothetical protein